MSYDLQIYSCSEPNVELVRLAVEEGFERSGNAFSLRGKNWQLIFLSADKVEPEDIPASVFRELPGIAYLTLANLEGATSISDRAKAIRIAKKFARTTRGVLVNPQDDTFPNGYGHAKRRRRASLQSLRESTNQSLPAPFPAAQSEQYHTRIIRLLKSELSRFQLMQAHTGNKNFQNTLRGRALFASSW